MNHRQTDALVSLLSLAIMISTAAAAPKTAGGPRDLRSRLAGAWRNAEHDDILHFDGDLCVSAQGPQQTIGE